MWQSFVDFTEQLPCLTPSLSSRAMSFLVAAAVAMAERIKINQTRRECRAERMVWIKRRRSSAPPVLALANLFFRLADARVIALRDAGQWQRWEMGCWRALHGDEFGAWAEGANAVAAEEMPGISLAHELDAGRLTSAQARAAGRELRRAHRVPSAAFRGAWSHGDPHTGNFLYDEKVDRARLIDFEVMHHRELPAAVRHADDLLIFLQDIVGRIEDDRWLPVASAFLDGYDCERTIRHLAPQLDLPRGIARVWWAVRTSYLPSPDLARRLAALRAVIGERTKAPEPEAPVLVGS